MPSIRYGYHATIASYVPDIARVGLVPNDGTRGMWPDELAVEGFLFFCDDVEGARYYQEQLRSAEPSFVLRFPRPKSSARDPNGDMMGERRSSVTVSGADIEIEIDGGWMPLVGLDESVLQR